VEAREPYERELVPSVLVAGPASCSASGCSRQTKAASEIEEDREEKPDSIRQDQGSSRPSGCSRSSLEIAFGLGLNNQQVSPGRDPPSSDAIGAFPHLGCDDGEINCCGLTKDNTAALGRQDMSFGRQPAFVRRPAVAGECETSRQEDPRGGPGQ